MSDDDPFPDLDALLLALRTVEISPVRLAVWPVFSTPKPIPPAQERPPGDRTVEIFPIILRG